MFLWKKLAAVCLTSLILLFLPGCWDIKNIQDFNYLTSIGFDYVGGQYIVYVQMLDFSSVAKTESEKPSQPVPVWVGHGKGDTAISAVNDLYRTSQMRLFYGQINSIVVSENVLKKGFSDVDELQHRYYEMRYTPWVFGTREPLDELFAVTPFFNLSPLMSLLHQPQESYMQESSIHPLTSREFVADIHEPGRAVFLPSLSLSSRNWKKDMEPYAMLDINGVFIFQNGAYRGWLGEHSVPGLRWLEPKTSRGPIIIRDDDGKPQAALSLESPKVNVIPHVKDNKATYTVEVNLTGNVSEMIQPLPESVLEQKAAALVQAEIRSTFERALELKADALQLEHALYRTKNKEWKRLRQEEGLKLTPEALTEIKTKVKLNNAGKLKL